MDWKGEQPTRIHLIHLETGEVTTKVSPAAKKGRVTQSYSILMPLPSLSMSFHTCLSHIPDELIQPPLPTHPTQAAPALWAFHFLNAYESDDGREVYLDIAKFETPKVETLPHLCPLLRSLFLLLHLYPHPSPSRAAI
jgi:hypothetical protein